MNVYQHSDMIIDCITLEFSHFQSFLSWLISPVDTSNIYDK